MDSTIGGSSTTPTFSLARKTKAKFKDVFKIELPAGSPPCKNVEHRIELIPRDNLVVRPLYHMSLIEEIELNKVKKVVDKYLSKVLICPSDCPFALPILIVRKKENSFRMGVDYRVLNKIIVKH